MDRQTNRKIEYQMDGYTKNQIAKKQFNRQTNRQIY